MRRLSLLVAAVLVPAIAGAQAAEQRPTIVPQPDTKLPLKHAPQPTRSDITAKDLMTRLYIFADDSMQGREAGTIGNVKGTDYIAHEVQRMGLRPAGDSGGYFQTIPLKTRSVDPTSTITANGSTLSFGRDWVAAGMKPVDQQNIQVIYGGLIGDTTTLITPEQAAGKFAVYALPQGPALMAAFRFTNRIPKGSAVVAIVAPTMIFGYFTQPQEFVDDPGTAQQGQGAVVFISADGASKLFTTPLGQLTPGSTGNTVSSNLKFNVQPVPFPARNVVAILPGRDAKLAGEYVAIGAHNDHIGVNNHPVDHDSIRIYNHIVRPEGAENQGAMATPEQIAQVNQELAAYRARHPGSQRPDSIANGADDDGSGSVSVLEIAEKMASLKGDDRPKRSILFVWHVGEEKGLLGSTYFTDHPTVPRDSIVAQLNMDMVGRGDAWDVTGNTKDGTPLHGGPKYLQLVGSHRLSTELGDLIEKVNNDGHHGMQIDYSLDANGHRSNIYCRSDHYEYARYGIPIAFFTTGLHSDYHQVTDEPEYIDYEHMEKVDNLVEDVAMHVANLDHRVVVDHPKPDPHGACQQ